MLNDCLVGELKNPSYAIPRGTITAVIFTFIIYNLLCVLVACSCDRLVEGSVRGTSINLSHPVSLIRVPIEVLCGGG